ncbi:MAG: methyltransferase domain-containing protein [Helicobacteraceae bacterium]|jgi:cyclopropane fatty-acyl-phospholipid synthase-like methyltransferase|nr:methyltransferase domain-containing protein [Helicobacteraceae bacterium]
MSCASSYVSSYENLENPLDLYAYFEPLIPFNNEIDLLRKIYIKELQNSGAKNVLDIGCGSGEFLLILNELGISAIGADLSAKMVEIARVKGVNAICIDLEDIQDNFDALTAVFDVVNYIAPKNLVNFFKAAKNRLNKNGVFIFDINTLYGFEEIACGSLALENDEIFSAARSEFMDNIFITKFDLFFKREDQSYIRKNFIIKQFYHNDRDIKNALKSAGFTQIESYFLNLYQGAKPDKKLFIGSAIS